MSLRSFQAAKTLLYGWGQTQALPLTKGTMDRVFNRPTCLSKEKDYALPNQGQVTHMAAGWGHSLLAIDEQTVYSYGLNSSGQLGTRQMTFDVQYLACGREHSHIVTKNGELYSFGNNMYGQLGLGENKNTAPGKLIAEKEPKLVDFKEEIKHITCGLDNTIFATENAIYGMGWSADGQLGQGKDDKGVPSKLNLSTHVKKLSSSTDFTLALCNDGKLWTWGNSEYGQGMQGKVIDRILEPLQVNFQDVKDIAAGGPFSVILTNDGYVHTCGYGALGLGKDTIQTLELKQVNGLKNINRVFATTDYAAAISESGELYTWGLNGPSGRLGLDNYDHAFEPRRVNMDRQVIDVSLGTNHAMALVVE